MSRFTLALAISLVIVSYAMGQSNKAANRPSIESPTPAPVISPTPTPVAEQSPSNSPNATNAARSPEQAESKSWLSSELISGLVGAIVGALFGAGASQFLATRHARQQLKFDTLRRFVANRFNTTGPEFTQVLNEIVIVYAGSPEVTAALSELSKGSTNGKLVALYRAMCKYAGVKDENVSDELFLTAFNIKNP